MSRYDHATGEQRPKETARKSAATTFSTYQPPGPARSKRTIYDLEDTFEVIVGKPPSPSKRFTLHTNVFKDQSSLVSAEPTTVGHPKQVILENEDPDLFQAYINCVYFGLEIVEQYTGTPGRSTPPRGTDDQRQQAADIIFEKQISLYLLAKRLNDYKIANLVIDAVMRFSLAATRIPAQAPVSLAFTDTFKDEPLRSLLHDLWIFGAEHTDIRRLRTNEFPYDFVHGVAIGLLEVKNLPPELRDDYQSVSSNCDSNACYYHSHDEKHPKCITTDPGEDRNN